MVYCRLVEVNGVSMVTCRSQEELQQAISTANPAKLVLIRGQQTHSVATIQPKFAQVSCNYLFKSTEIARITDKLNTKYNNEYYVFAERSSIFTFRVGLSENGGRGSREGERGSPNGQHTSHTSNLVLGGTGRRAAR